MRTRDEERAFLAAIAAAPDDDAPRLMYADWLMERGDPRGEFIRYQVTAAGLPAGDPRRKQLTRAADAIFLPHREEWQAALRELGASEVKWERGFPSTIDIAADHFIRGGEQILANAPVVRARILGPCPTAEFARCPHLSRLTHLTFEANPIDAEGVGHLAASPHVRTLRSLTLWRNDVGPEGTRHIAASPYLTNLTHLTLDWCGIETVGAEALAARPTSSKLTHLSLQRNDLRDSGARYIATSPHFRNLTGLHLSGNHIGNEGAGYLATSPHMTNLVHLDLSQNDIGSEGVRAIAASRHLKNLDSLSLFINGPFELEDAISLVRGHLKLTRLDLEDCGLGARVLHNIDRTMTKRRRDLEGGRGTPE